MAIYAYLQGHLDCLCGLYSVINAARLVHGGLRGDKAWDLFYDCAKHIEERKRLLRNLTVGLSGADVRALLRNVLAGEYEIPVRRPFPKAAGVRPGSFLGKVREFLDGGSNRAVIVCFATGWDLAHWAVIKSVSKKYIILSDSAGCKRISQKKLTTRKATSRKPVLLATRDTYFLSNGR